MKSEKQRHQQQQYKNCFYNILNARITGAIIHTLSIIRKKGSKEVKCEREEEAERMKRIGK